MIVMVGASASGKTELAKILYQHFGYQKCVTTTTRSPRVHEKDGIDYHFIDFSQFDYLSLQGDFVESSSYHGNHYGIQKKDVKSHSVVIVEPNGANTLIEKMGTSVCVVYVHASEQLRKERMRLRGDHPSMIDERIQFDREIFTPSMLNRIDLVIENERESLEKIALKIDRFYQKFLHDSAKK